MADGAEKKEETKIEDTNIAAQKDTEKEIDLGEYRETMATDRLSQDQMLGIGGGTCFWEIIDSEGSAVKHIAMPALLKDRQKVKDFVRLHAQLMLEKFKIIEKAGAGSEQEMMENQTDIITKIDEIEEKDFDCLLGLAYICFARTDKTLKGKTEREGIEYLKGWMNEAQLEGIADVAMGLNRLSPLRMGAGMNRLNLPSL